MKDDNARHILAHALLTATLALPMDGSWTDTALSVLQATQDVLAWRPSTDHGTMAGRAFVMLLQALCFKSPLLVKDLDTNIIEWKLAPVSFYLVLNSSRPHVYIADP